MEDCGCFCSKEGCFFRFHVNLSGCIWLGDGKRVRTIIGSIILLERWVVFYSVLFMDLS